MKHEGNQRRAGERRPMLLDLAARLRELALTGLPEVFHVVNAGDGASYEEFAQRWP